MHLPPRWGSLIVGPFFILLGAVAAMGFGAPLLDSLHARAWPRAPGVVQSSSVARSAGTHGSVFAPRVVYTYAVDGVRYEGDTLTFTPHASNTSYAWDSVDDYPAGAHIDVYYDPAHPDRSVLRPGLDAFAVATTALAMLFVLIGVGALVGAFERRAGPGAA